ncbi:hypothetical protein BJF83_17125 [Nocardiopsis sp. CNR-923]|uniref:hypothetical protein n=1 Tax=Nocardiopsis sp. CNR-923 TaxID=1904965 RepID=UPI0009682F58|nr:hypothetical protein [Nocardiopsis sp. CNR-923]OLT27840.1 hypothetical protein BJF83_17125 [Nocardiopsis sp. CNR-923]
MAAPILAGLAGAALRFVGQRALMPALRWVGSKGATWLAARGGWKGLGKSVGRGLLTGALKLLGKGLGALPGLGTGAVGAIAAAGAAGLKDNPFTALAALMTSAAQGGAAQSPTGARGALDKLELRRVAAGTT